MKRTDNPFWLLASIFLGLLVVIEATHIIFHIQGKDDSTFVKNK
jgi:hypothetical protein